MDNNNPIIEDALGRLFTARCLVEMANTEQLPQQTQIHLATVRHLLVAISDELTNAS